MTVTLGGSVGAGNRFGIVLVAMIYRSNAEMMKPKKKGRSGSKEQQRRYLFNFIRAIPRYSPLLSDGLIASFHVMISPFASSPIKLSSNR